MNAQCTRIVCTMLTTFLLAITPALSLPSGYGSPGAGHGNGSGTPIEKIHGCHRSCEWGPGLGWWHRHTGYACRAIACDSRRPPGFWDEPGYRRFPSVYRYRKGCGITPWGEVFCRF
jgi:hypothetical protein